MAPKEAVKKPAAPIVRQPISDSSLLFVPQDALEGYQERIETGIDWTLAELGARHHRKRAYSKEEIPAIPFSQALENNIQRSVLGGFLNEMSNISLDQQFDFIMAAALWDNEKFANDEGKLCFKSANCITDNIVALCRKAVQIGDRKALWNALKKVEILRVTDAQMTELDEGLLEFEKLVSLNFCGNFIKDIDATFIPPTVRSLELQANHINSIETFAKFLPADLIYLGLAKNLLTSASAEGLSQLPYNLTVVDLSDNDIYDLEPVLDALIRLPNLTGLYLAGNPCSVCAGYARMVFMTLRRLKWLDSRKILPADLPQEPFEMHPDDLRSAYFNFTVIRIMSAPQPPKAEKGAITAFHVELEIPLLDSYRRRFLMFRHNESLIELLPPPEDEEVEVHLTTSVPHNSRVVLAANLDEESSQESDIYEHLVAKSSREILNFTMFESNKIQWAKVMNFQEPTVKIFCPDLTALRNTFRSVITLRLVYSVVTAKPAKAEKKSTHALKVPGELRVTLATVRCHLRNPDWSQPSQHFHWDDSLGTNDAIHWGDGDLAILQYSQQPVKAAKGKADTDTNPASRQYPPENLTCHFGFGIETLRQ